MAEKPVQLDLRELERLANRFDQIDKTAERGARRIAKRNARLDREAESAGKRRRDALRGRARTIRKERTLAGSAPDRAIGGAAETFGRRLAGPLLGFATADKAFELAGQLSRAIFENRQAGETLRELVKGLVPEFVRPFVEQREREFKRQVQNTLDAFRTEQLEALSSAIRQDPVVTRAASESAARQYAQTPEGQRLLERAQGPR